MREQRKLVTILFADVVGSTEFAANTDPEVVRAAMARHFKRIAEVAEAYGGTVEKFAGDAAMVVFGVPVVHDDDAERAVRAALEMRDGAAELEIRVGVNTGEAVTASREDKQFMVSGDAVNVAARLQQGAEPGEVVVGPLTEQLTRKVIGFEPRAPVAAKGKPEPLRAFRATVARTKVPEQARGVPGLHAPLVGRDRELRLLLDTYARTAEDRRPHLFTLVGSAGVGKSRLVSEALVALSDSGARVLRGRCLPYGRGITYWPFIEMLRQDTGIGLSDEREVAIAKLDRWLGELLHENPQRPAVRARLSVMLGFETAESAMPDTPGDRVENEIGWALRHYFVAVARASPLIVVIDDVQWAEPPVVRLIEQLGERAADVPMLIICVARPEFLENRSGWSSGTANSSTITLDPLNASETGTLISRLLEIEALPPGLREQIVERSGGTPLFCEEFIHMLIDEGLLVRHGASWRTTGTIEQIRVPQSINAVLATRLDILPEREKITLQAASVIGQRFEMRQLRALISGQDLEADVESLRRKGLLTGADGAGDEHLFRHLLIRDAAYGSQPKSERASLHDRFRSVLEAETGDPQQILEILAHHAERAFGLSLELGLDDSLIVDRARSALRWSLAMADRARTRNDIRLLDETLSAGRSAAAAVPGGGGANVLARLRLLEAQLMVMKADYSGARRAAADAAVLAEQAQLLPLVATVVERAIDACRRAGDVPAEIEARHVGTNILWATGRLAEFVSANEELIRQARSIGDVAHVAAISVRLVGIETLRGNAHVAERHMLEAETLATEHGFRNVALRIQFDRAALPILVGDLGTAEAKLRECEEAAIEAGAPQHQISALRSLGSVMLHSGRPVEAEAVLDKALEISQATGERWNRSELLGLRARAALESGDPEAADRHIRRALESLRPEDRCAISEVYNHLGAIAAARGRDDEAETSLRRALQVLLDTEYNQLKTEAALALASFLAVRGRTAEAASLVDEYSRLAHGRGWHLWDGTIAATQEAIAAKGQA